MWFACGIKVRKMLGGRDRSLPQVRMMYSSSITMKVQFSTWLKEHNKGKGEVTLFSPLSWSRGHRQPPLPRCNCRQRWVCGSGPTLPSASPPLPSPSRPCPCSTANTEMSYQCCSANTSTKLQFVPQSNSILTCHGSGLGGMGGGSLHRYTSVHFNVINLSQSKSVNAYMKKKSQ